MKYLQIVHGLRSYDVGYFFLPSGPHLRSTKNKVTGHVKRNSNQFIQWSKARSVAYGSTTFSIFVFLLFVINFYYSFSRSVETYGIYFSWLNLRFSNNYVEKGIFSQAPEWRYQRYNRLRTKYSPTSYSRQANWLKCFCSKTLSTILTTPINFDLLRACLGNIFFKVAHTVSSATPEKYCQFLVNQIAGRVTHSFWNS